MGGGLVVVVEHDWLCGDRFHKVVDERELVLVCHRPGPTISVAVYTRDMLSRDEPVTRFSSSTPRSWPYVPLALSHPCRADRC